MIRAFYIWGDMVKRSLDCLSKRLIKLGAAFLVTPRWVVGACGFSLPFGAALPGGAGLKFLSLTMRYSGSEV